MNNVPVLENVVEEFYARSLAPAQITTAINKQTRAEMERIRKAYKPYSESFPEDCFSLFYFARGYLDFKKYRVAKETERQNLVSTNSFSQYLGINKNSPIMRHDKHSWLECLSHILRQDLEAGDEDIKRFRKAIQAARVRFGILLPNPWIKFNYYDRDLTRALDILDGVLESKECWREASSQQRAKVIQEFLESYEGTVSDDAIYASFVGLDKAFEINPEREKVRLIEYPRSLKGMWKFPKDAPPYNPLLLVSDLLAFNNTTPQSIGGGVLRRSFNSQYDSRFDMDFWNVPFIRETMGKGKFSNPGQSWNLEFSSLNTQGAFVFDKDRNTGNGFIHFELSLPSVTSLYTPRYFNSWMQKLKAAPIGSNARAA